MISVLSKISHRFRGWLPLMVSPLLVLVFVPRHYPRWSLMWSLLIAIFYSCKWLTWRRTPHRAAPLWRSVVYLLIWPGMDALAFFNTALRPAKPSLSEWLFALAKSALGFVLLFGLAKHDPPADPYWLGWIGMTGIILLLHFGSFHLISCALRAAGIEATPLMNWPLASVRLSDYWSRGWNTAFRDLTNRFLFRPLARKSGSLNALWIGFLVSGLIHDIVVSIPARGGYGGPTLFFLIQALGLMIERTKTGRRMGLGAGLRGWLFTMALLLLPAPLLFHRPFVTRIIVPFMHAIGAAP